MRRLAIIAGLLLSPVAFGQTIGPSSGGSSPTNVVVNPYRVANAADNSGSVATGGAWQQVAPANLVRRRLFIQNYCEAQYQGIGTAESIFIQVLATQPTSLVGALEISTCGSYDSDAQVIGTNPVWVYANTTGHKFVEKEW